MDPSLGLVLEIVIFVVLLYFLMYIAAVKGPIAKRVRKWRVEAREARKAKAKREEGGG